MLEKCKVLSKADFKNQYPNGFKPLKRSKPLANKNPVAFYCERGYNSTWGRIDPKVTWSEFKSEILDDLDKLVNPKKRTKATLKKPIPVSLPKKALSKSKSRGLQKKKTKSLFNEGDEEAKYISDDAASSGDGAISTSGEDEASSSESSPSEAEFSSSDDGECKSSKKLVSYKSRQKISPRRIQKARMLSVSLSKRVLEKPNAETSFQKASERLHVSAIPLSLPCREDEFANIYTQLESAIEDGKGQCICILCSFRYFWCAWNRQDGNGAGGYSRITRTFRKQC